MPTLSAQFAWLFGLAIPVACVAWTVTHEELFREPHEYCVKRSQKSRHWYQRKFFYLFTCEYCFSHYVAAFFLLITGYRFLADGWAGVLIALFAVVWIANQYMSLYGRLRLDIREEQIEIKQKEEALA